MVDVEGSLSKTYKIMTRNFNFVHKTPNASLFGFRSRSANQGQLPAKIKLVE